MANESSSSTAKDVVDKFKWKMQNALSTLALKKKQLSDTRKELDSIKMEQHNLSFKLKIGEKEKTSLTDNLNSVLKAKENVEAQLKQHIDLHNTESQQLSEANLEIKFLKDFVANIQSEKHDLLQKLEDLKLKNCSTFTHQQEKDIFNELNQNKALQNKIVEINKRLENSQSLANALLKSLEKCSQKMDVLEYYKQQITDLITERDKFQIEIEYYKGQVDTYADCIRKSKFLTNDKQAQYFYEQWQKNLVSYNEDTKRHTMIVENLLESLKKERDINLKVFQRESELIKKLNQLESNLEGKEERTETQKSVH